MRFFIPIITIPIYLVINTSIFAAPGDILNAIPSPSPCPTGLESIERFLYLSDRKTDTIYVIDPESGKVTDSFPTPGLMPSGLAYDGKFLWCIDRNLERVFAIDILKKTTMKEIPAPCPSPSGLAFDGKNLVTSDPWKDKIYFFSIGDGTSIKTLPSPSGDPTGLTFDGRYIWVSDRVADEIFMINPEDGEVINSFPSPYQYPWGLAYDGKYLFNADYQAKKIVKIIRMDEEKVRLSEPRNEKIEFTQEIRNYGPDTLDSVEIYIAIPPSVRSQKFRGKIRFTPTPTSIKKDKWGQEFAIFKFKDIKMGEKVSSVMQVRTTLYSVKYFIYPENCGSMSDIPQDIKKLYLRDGEKLDIFHPDIRKASQKLSKGEKNPYRIMRKIYDFVLEKMEYELADGWNPAPLLLKRGSGSCSEYSFLFISLLRASGIPARYIGSVVMRKDESSFDDIYHRWVEVYIPGYDWIPVDPSRGDKKTPVERFKAIGHLTNDILITTISGGDSEFLDWGYNSNYRYRYKGRAKVEAESIAEWEPDIEETTR